ncbi:hypothetical protein TM7_0145 [candidate division TM7 genomosp. GTL1]|nr:hypothetical protein TM7_0145 [candidate division TM7 genomosp. GTL1]
MLSKKDKPEPKQKLPSANNISIEVSSPTYSPSYKYDAKKKVYHRFLGGKPHVDREKGLITPRVVIAMKVQTVIGFEDGYREQMTTNGSGDAYIFQDGVVVKGKWHKKNTTDQLKFTDKNNKEIPLARGQTWITATPTDREVTWR